MTEPKYFARPESFRKWFEANHSKVTELLVGFYKRDSGKPSIKVDAKLEDGEERAFRANKNAAAFFDAQANWYRRTVLHGWSARNGARRARNASQS